MIPIGDEIRSRRVPVVNYTLLAVNIVVFFLTSLPGDSFFMATIMDFGLIPAQLFGGNGAAALPDFFTSMFLHGAWCIWAGTCSTCGSSATMWKMRWAMWGIRSSTWQAACWRR
ncbi:MAG: rhomboid family intramembrane serine protease [Caldilineaceae bacterium]